MTGLNHQLKHSLEVYSTTHEKLHIIAVGVNFANFVFR